MYYLRRIRRLPLESIFADGFRIEATWKRGRRFSIMFHDEVVWQVRLDQDSAGFIPQYLSDVFQLLSEYLNTPRDQLLDFKPTRPHTRAGQMLASILPLMDRRVSKHHLGALLFATDDPIVRTVIAKRYRKIDAA